MHHLLQKVANIKYIFNYSMKGNFHAVYYSLGNYIRRSVTFISHPVKREVPSEIESGYV